MTLHLVHATPPGIGGSAFAQVSDRPITTLHLSKLVITYDSLFALRCKKLSAAGNIIGLIGHNGAGKSTLLKAALNLLPIKSGEITVTINRNGAVARIVPEKHFAFCPESGAVFADISVENYIKLWCRIRHSNSRYYLGEGSRYIELLNLQPLLPKLGRELSKGQRRRVQTAIGFFMKPELFLLDEPFDGLDVQKTHELSEIIEAHASQMSFIISSHRMDVIERLSDCIIVLDQGDVLTSGDVKHVTTALAGQSISFTVSGPADVAVKALKQRFPALLVNHIGSRIVVTGENASINSIKEALRNCVTSVNDIEESNPNLVDAMNHHLRKASLPSTA